MNMKKTLIWLAVGYLGVVAAAQVVTASSSNSPTADTVSALPSLASFLSISGTTTGALVDAGAAGALWWAFLR